MSTIKASVVPSTTSSDAHSIDPEKYSTDAGLEEGTAESADYLTGLPLGLVVLGLCLAVLLVGLDNSILATAIPTITTKFNSLDDVGWYGSAFLICM